jgi:hypothetical protein
MNLYEQLIPTHRDMILAEVDKYPATGRLIMHSLEHNGSVIGLTIREATDIHSIFYPYEPFSLSNLYSLFA